MERTVPKGGVGVHDVTLAPGEVLTVTFADDLGAVEVVNLDGAAEVYATVNNQDNPPAVQGQHCWCIPAAITARVLQPPGPGGTVVRLVSAGAPRVSVARAS